MTLRAQKYFFHIAKYGADSPLSKAVFRWNTFDNDENKIADGGHVNNWPYQNKEGLGLGWDDFDWFRWYNFDIKDSVFLGQFNL